MSRWYKQSNMLARLLDVPGQSVLFSNIQKFEKQLKKDGHWAKAKEINKNRGKEKAISYLTKVFEDYSMNTEIFPPDVDTKDTQIKYKGRTKTGGDWYWFGDHYEFMDIENGYEEDYFEESSFLYKSFAERVKNSFANKIEEHLEWKKNTIINKLNEGLSEIKKRLSAIGKNQLTFDFHDQEDQLYVIGKKYEKRIEKTKNFTEKLKKEINKGIEKVDIDSFSNVKDFLSEKIGDIETLNIINDVEDEKNSIKEDLWKSHTESLKTDLDTLEEEYTKVTCGGHWCISQPGDHLGQFISMGDTFLILRRDGDPRVAIRMNQDGEIIEVQGVYNNFNNLNAKDVIDLLDVPGIDSGEILDTMAKILLKDNYNHRDPDLSEARETLMSALEDSEDDEITGLIEKEIIRLGSEFVRILFPRDADIETLLNSSSISGKLKYSICKAIGDNLNDIELGYSGVEMNGLNGSWLAFGTGLLERHSYDDDIMNGLKLIFGGKEIQLVDEFLEESKGIEKKEFLKFISKYSTTGISSLVGNEGISYIKQYLEEEGLVGDYIYNNYLFRGGIWDDEDFRGMTIDNFMRVKSLVINKIIIANPKAKDIHKINELWERGKELFPKYNRELAIDICSDILTKYKNKYGATDNKVQYSYNILSFIHRDLFLSGLSKELLGVMKGFSEVKEALAIAMDAKNNQWGIDHQMKLDAFPDPYEVKDDRKVNSPDIVHNPAIEGLPNVPVNNMNGNRGIMAKKQGWYK